MATRSEIVCPAMIKGSPEWRKSKTSWVRVSLKDMKGSARPVAHNLVALREVIEGDDGDDWDRFVRDELDCEPEFTEKIIEGVALIEHWKPKANPTIEQALAAPAARQPGNPQAATANPYGRAGKPGSKVRNTKVGSGENATYRVARLKRDAPQVVEDLKAGKHRSVNAAWRHAIETGAVEIRSRRSPVERIVAVVQKVARDLDAEQRAELLAAMREMLEA